MAESSYVPDDEQDEDDPREQSPARSRGIGRRTAIALVFGSSAAVLVLELVSLRLAAPYLGLTLETSTAVIGIALAAIATGAALGGRFADQVPPARVLGPLVLLGGAVVLLVVPIVRWTGQAVGTSDGAAMILVIGLVLFVPAAILAAVTPMVTKLQLASLAETGTVVGRLSAWGTGGAIVGTVLTGFVFVANWPTSRIVIGLGVLLVLVGLALTVWLRGWREAAKPMVLALIGGTLTVTAPRFCQVETAYHCARVIADPAHPNGRSLFLDDMRHSYVDLADPTHLESEYIKATVAAIEAKWPEASPLRALYVGGGGLTVPRYVSHTRPGAQNKVYEIDRGVVRLDTDELGAKLGPDLDVRIRDGRLGVRSEPDDSRDLVFGDAFGGRAVPWHLTTREMVAEIHRVLTDEGLYVANLIDFGPLGFARAEIRTLQDRFRYLAVLSRRPVLDRTGAGGNIVVVASDAPLPVDALRQHIAGMNLPYGVLSTEPELRAFVGDSPILTDDYAPVDQLLTPFGHS